MSEKAIVKFDPTTGFVFEDIDGMFRAARCFLDSGFAPKNFTTEQQLIICWARAAELGIRPLQAIEGMNVINGRLGIGGDLALAKVRSMGLLVNTPKKVYSGSIGQDDYTCTVTIHRKGEDPMESSFSIREAKLAGIYKNNWPLYPQRMVYYRALGFGLRDVFSDVLKGMSTTEELEDLGLGDAQPPWVADEAKIAANQAAEEEQKTAGVKFVESHGTRPSPAEAVEPAFPEDKDKPAAAQPRTPAFAQKLAEEQAAVTQAAQGLAKDVAKEEVAPKEVAPLKVVEAPDDLDITPAPKPVAPAEPEWKNHVIRSIAHPRFIGKKISELDPKDLLKVETQWIPKIEADMDNASEDQKLEYRLFQSAIAHAKMAKPF